MYKFDKRQKVLIAIIVAIIVGIIAYYFYSKENTNELNIEELEVENTTAQSNENANEVESNIVVHISGCVNQEGIVKLEANSRIADAIEKAGGLKENADISKINLAYLLEDGMKIYIPSIEETKASENETQESTTSTQISNSTTYNTQSKSTSTDNTKNYITTTPSSDEQSDSSDSSSQKININTATQTELETLPGIGPSTALKIINYRSENGKFSTIEDIKNVKGIGDSKFNNIKDYITVK